MQGKTQLFPSHESDFFRNRLTHSLEVAQIAEGIAEQLNYNYRGMFGQQRIDERLCAAAALIHDLGHPPFGHNGERALDSMMVRYGGFEGNAQSLRIVARLEKKAFSVAEGRATGEDLRLGLNLTYRVLASILKYDKLIPQTRKRSAGVAKGYYKSEEGLVARIKRHVCPGIEDSVEFKTIECQIMDLADDIAYSTYDFEDCLKAGFLTPAIIMSSSNEILESVAQKVRKIKADFTARDVLRVFASLFKGMTKNEEAETIETEISETQRELNQLIDISLFNKASTNLSENSHDRTRFSGELVSNAICNIVLEPNHKHPALSVVRLRDAAKIQVEVLKQYTYMTTIESSRVKVSEFRGYALVREIFASLAGPKGMLLMPSDVRSWYEAATTDGERKRTICDFVAGMTDRYAIEFYARLHSDTAQSIFKPL